jgi:hypothetical protein
MTERRDQIRDLSISTHDRRAGIFIAPVMNHASRKGTKVPTVKERAGIC